MEHLQILRAKATLTIEPLDFIHDAQDELVKSAHPENPASDHLLKAFRFTQSTLKVTRLDTMMAGKRVMGDVVVSRVLDRVI